MIPKPKLINLSLMVVGTGDIDRVAASGKLLPDSEERN